ncbi:unnamed protein product [Cuscuta campestris]|uniref:Kazal-like domain-containing protein n=1 Tax=Cuscuta campestris TaxID=132261 RepID=A0A484NDF5_9ASTE|nr:unnamed protein product [Cuscuta campestris]
MISLSNPPYFLIAFSLFIVILCSPTAVLGESSDNLILLPSDDRDNDAICPIQDSGDSCPINCFRPDPVCGVNGVTYWCGCADAHCNGVEVARLGFCDVGNGGSGPISGQALLLTKKRNGRDAQDASANPTHRRNQKLQADDLHAARLHRRTLSCRPARRTPPPSRNNSIDVKM